MDEYEHHVLRLQAETAGIASDAELARQRPFMLLRPQMFPDGNRWCALYGEDFQMGVAGFGDTPNLASLDFDKNWMKQTLTNKDQS